MLRHDEAATRGYGDENDGKSHPVADEDLEEKSIAITFSDDEPAALRARRLLEQAERAGHDMFVDAGETLEEFLEGVA